MIAGVVIDAWKLPIFKQHLDAAGYQYTEHAGLTAETWILKVKCDFMYKLQPIIKAAWAECRKIKAGGPT